MGRSLASYFITGGLLLSLAGCNAMESSGGKMTAEKSLYDRLGGKPAITAVVEDFVGRVAADKRINGTFANVNIPRLKSMLVDQICRASGGPCTYSGRDVKSTHAGMAITSGDFDALVGDRGKNELLDASSPMKCPVVREAKLSASRTTLLAFTAWKTVAPCST